MDFRRFRDPRVRIAAGVGAAALLAALGISIGAVVRSAAHHNETSQSEALAESGGPTSLSVEMGSGDAGLDLTKPLRCFAGGQFVGMLPLKDCAQKNGVDPGQLDVGLDTSGEVTASPGADALPALPAAAAPPVAPLPSPPPPQPSPLETGPQAAAPAGEQGACWRYAGEWRKLSDGVSLDACVQALFAGKCVRPGGADYGRWGEDTIRLVAGKIERQVPGGGFRTLTRLAAGDCPVSHPQE